MGGALPCVTVRRSERVISARVEVPADKSISHRALMLGALATGRTRVEGRLFGRDVLSTVECLRGLGVAVLAQADGSGAHQVFEVVGGLPSPHSSPVLDCGNSGTSMRLLMGLLAGRGLGAQLIGDASLMGRPMERVAAPLREMGALIDCVGSPGHAPVTIHPASRTPSLLARDLVLPVASAQVKSALMLAALGARGTTRLSGKTQSRDHTERLFAAFGLRCEVDGEVITVPGEQTPHGANVLVPGDLSSAAFWMGAVAPTRQARMEIVRVSLNPTRLGLVHVLRRMGVSIDVTRVVAEAESFGDLLVSGGDLHATRVGAEEIPALIDEIPLLAVIATQAHGTTRLEGLTELRVKESDRLAAIVDNLARMGAQTRLGHDSSGDWLEIDGRQSLHGAEIDSRGDHRLAMAFAVAGLFASGPTQINEATCVDVSYPGFWQEWARVVEAR